MGSRFPIATDQVQSNSSLFSLGLSSISAISFASMLKQSGFDKANVATIMKNQTVGQLAAMLSNTTAQEAREDDDVQQARLGLKAYAQRYRGAAAKSGTPHGKVWKGERHVPLAGLAPCHASQNGGEPTACTAAILRH